jgi:hypothetical protein
MGPKALLAAHALRYVLHSKGGDHKHPAQPSHEQGRVQCVETGGVAGMKVV